MRNVIADAYAALRSVTPLPNGLDCGRLCGSRCCTGTANDGMDLVHGEAKRFEHDPDFTVRESNSAMQSRLSRMPLFWSQTGFQLTPRQGALMK